jgi:hypothetical protein
MKRVDAPDPSASVYVQPAPHGVWSGNNNFGFEIAFGPDSGNRERIINLPEWGEPAVWTVSLGIDYSENAWPTAPSRGFDVVAEVSYGVGGATETVLVDWIQGATFSVPMNALSINASYSGPIIEEPPRPPDNLVLRVLISRGTISTGLPPTKFAELLDGNIFTVIPNDSIATSLARIPKFGRRLFVVPLVAEDANRLTNGNNYVRFFSAPDLGSDAFATGTYKLDTASVLSGVPVPPFSKYVTIENQGGGADDAAAFFNFELQL